MSYSVIGKHAETGKEVTIEQSVSLASTYIPGAPGTGKSGLMSNLALQSINQGHGVMIIDPHGPLIYEIIKRCPKRLEDIILLDLSDSKHVFGLNLYECDDPSDPYEVQKRVSAIIKVFGRLFDTGRSETPRLLQYVRNFSYLITKNQLTLYEMTRLFVEDIYRQKCLQNVTDQQIRLFFMDYDKMNTREKKEDSSSTRNKLDELLSPIIRNVVGQEHTTINLREIMDARKILLIKLDAETDDILTLMGAMFLSELLRAAYSRQPSKKGGYAHFAVYLDEFPKYATADFSLLVSETRKYGVAMTYANQSFEQAGMDRILLSTALQAATKIVFRVSGKDSDEISSEFKFPEPEPVVVGTRPILTPPQDTIKHLLTNGHKNPMHVGFVHNYLRPTKEAIKFYDEPMLRGNLIRVTTWSQSGGEFAFGLGMAMVGGLFKQDWGGNVPVPYVSSPFPELQKLLYAVQQTKSNAFDIPYEVIRGFCNCGIGYYRLVHELLSREDVELLGKHGTDFPERLQRVKEKNFMNWDRANELGQLLHFIQNMRQILYVLSIDPILTNSGQVEPVYGSPRPYVDVVNEYKQKLANLQNFHAFAKLTGASESFLILKTINPDEMFPIKPITKPDGTVIKPNPQRLLEDRIAEIKARNLRDGYIRPVKEVEEEIAARWNNELPTTVRKTLI